MPTDCSPDSLVFGTSDGRELVGAFDGGAVTSNGGVLLMGAVDRRIGLVGKLARCFTDHRQIEGGLEGFALELGRMRLLFRISASVQGSLLRDDWSEITRAGHRYAP